MSEKKEEKEPTRFIKKFMNGEGPVRNFLKQTTGLTEDNLTNEQKKLTDAFREGIAEALGIPPEYIKEEPVMRWVLEFTRAFVKPEHLKETIIPPLRRVRLFGQEIGQIIREGIEQIDNEEPEKERLIEKITKTPTPPAETIVKEEKASDISIE